MIVHLIGPGGAGKSTTGSPLADQLGCRCIDLDEEYMKRSDIGEDVDSSGYAYYVRKNIDLYLSLTSELRHGVIVTSSGFMTYNPSIHKDIARIHESILQSATTVLLLPSFEPEACITEIVKRQLTKSHESKSIEEQTERISTRFPIYHSMGRIKVATDKPVAKVVNEIIGAIGAHA